MKKYSLLALIVAVFALSLLQGCGYNSMQANEEAVFAAWGDVEATYQRRADLIPNLEEQGADGQDALCCRQARGLGIC